MSKSSRAVESFSRLVIAVIAAFCLIGGVAWAFVAFDDHGCGGGISCSGPVQHPYANP